MNFSELIKMLPTTPLLMSAGKDDLPILEIELLDGTQREFKRETLYFGYEEQLVEPLPAQFIVEGLTGDTSHFDHLCWAVLPKGTLFWAFNITQRILSDVVYVNIDDELLKLSCAGSDLNACLQTAATYLRETLILIDPECRVMAHFATKPILDKLWQENISQGFCSYEFIQAVRDQGISNLIYENKGPVEVSCSESPYRKYCVAIHVNGVCSGFLLMITNETVGSSGTKITSNLLEKFAKVASGLSKILTMKPLTSGSRSLYQTVLYDLLIGAPVEKLAQMIESLRFPALMEVLCLSPITYLGKGFMKEHIAKLFKDLFPSAHITFFDSDIVVVIDTNLLLSQTSSEHEQLVKQLEGFAREHSLRIGISDFFENIGLFSWHYLQAKTAVKLSYKLGRENLVSQYADYRVFDLLDHFSEKQKLSAYYHPAIQRLQSYDLKYGTQLLRTLDVFLQNNGNIKKTSAALYIHRNSLSYRLDRICEIGNLSLNDSRTRLQLWLSCRIAEYLQQI